MDSQHVYVLKQATALISSFRSRVGLTFAVEDRKVQVGDAGQNPKVDQAMIVLVFNISVRHKMLWTDFQN